MDHVLVDWTAVELLQSLETYALTYLVKTVKFRQRKASILVVITGKMETLLVDLADPKITYQNNRASVRGESILFTADISSVSYVDVYTLSFTSKFKWKSIQSHGQLYSP